MAERKPNPNALRDHLANERTLLSWVRTSVAMIGLGFVVSKFGLLLHEVSGTHVHHMTQIVGNWVGILLVLSGVLSVSLAVGNFERIRRGINRDEVAFSPQLAITVACLVVAVSLILSIYLILTG